MNRIVPSAGLNGGRNRNGRHNTGNKKEPTEAQIRASNRKRRKKGNFLTPVPKNATPSRNSKSNLPN